MKWKKALTVLAARKKIDSAAMFDKQGNLLSRTENFAEKQEHIEAVLKVLTATSHLKLLKLRVFGDVFTCVSPGSVGILLAQAQDRLFVAVRSPCCMVIAFSNQRARGSCLYEVMEFTKLLENKVCPYAGPYTLPEASEEASVESSVDSSVEASVEVSVDSSLETSLEGSVEASVDSSVEASV